MENFFFFIYTVGNTAFFSNLPPTPPFSNLPPHFQISRRRGGKSRDRGSGGGNFILEKIFTSPGTKLPHYYLGGERENRNILTERSLFS